MNLYPLIDGGLYQAGLVGTIDMFIHVQPSIVIDCTYDPVIMGYLSKVLLKIPFTDASFPMGQEGFMLYSRLRGIAACAANFLRNGERILTHCNAGENRSSLVNGLILIAYRNMGLIEFDSVVDFIRQKRPGALQNESFSLKLKEACAQTK